MSNFSITVPRSGIDGQPAELSLTFTCTTCQRAYAPDPVAFGTSGPDAGTGPSGHSHEQRSPPPHSRARGWLCCLTRWTAW